MKFLIAPLTDFPVGARRIVRVEGREIGVFHVGDRFFAVRNRCPHQGAPLCLGRLLPRLVSSEPGVIDVDCARPPLIACPWHGWQYDVLTGEAYAPGDPNARTYNVAVESGDRLEGPCADEVVRYVAETFTVDVEGDYVVLNV